MSESFTATVMELQRQGILRVEDGNHGESRPRPNEFVQHGTAFIRAADMDGGQVLFEQASKINAIASERITKGIGRSGDILISHKGTIGRVARAPANAPPFVCSPQTTFWRATDAAKLDQDFLYAVMRSPKFQAQFAVRSGETDMALYVSLTSQRQLVLAIPPINVQREIAEIIGSLDDKIELNRRTNETLEAMAQAIFRDWFVDFGPTRRKMEGVTDPVTIVGGLVQDAELAQALADQFPDALADQGRPAGWQGQPLLDQANWINGAAYKDMYFSDAPDALPVVKIAELKNGITTSTKRTNTNLGDKYLIQDGELLFSWSGNPDTSIDSFFWIGGDAWLNQHIFAVRENGTRARSVLYVLLKALMPKLAELARNKQTTGLGHVTKEDMRRLEVIVAPPPLEATFEALVRPMVDLVVSKLVENRTLVATRDLLLPKLMSGEIRLREAEEMLETFQ